MPFNISDFNKLNTAAQSLEATYVEKKLNGISHFLIGWFATPTNPERLQDINFISKLANNIIENAWSYSQMDPKHHHQDYQRVIWPFLTRVLAGGLLYVLTKISRTYCLESSVKERSTLARIILDSFDINALSEVPTHEKIECFRALRQYIEVINHDKELQCKVYQWHPTIANMRLDEELTQAIDACESTGWTPASLFS